MPAESALLFFPSSSILTPATAPPVGGRFVDAGLVLTRGSYGEPDWRLDGAISPCEVWASHGLLNLHYIGAASTRQDDGGPAFRGTIRAVSRDGGRTWEKRGLVHRWGRGNPEAGDFNAVTGEYSAITAINLGATWVTCDIRRLRDDALILSHKTPGVWGGGDELFAHSVLPDGSRLYLAKGGGVQWGLGRLFADGRTVGLIQPPAGEEVCGGGSVGAVTVLVRGLDVRARNLEWYDSPDVSWPLRVDRIEDAQHAVPYHDGETWWLYTQTRDGQTIRRARWTPDGSHQAGTDEIDPCAVHWHHAEMGRWPITSRVTVVSVDPLTIAHTQAGRWPTFEQSGHIGEGNPWIFAYLDGRWHGGTFEWFRPGQIRFPHITAATIGPHTKRAPLDTWRPRPGELVGFAMSTPGRDHHRTSNERTNIVLRRWVA